MKRVLIVAGSSGIGSHAVEEFSRAGYDVLFTYFTNSGCAKDVEQKNHAKGFRLNTVEEREVMNLFSSISRDFGSLDALVYCAGIFEDSLAADMPLESWDRVIGVGLTGAFLCIKHALPMLRKSGNGRIICMGSVMGDLGCYGSSSYSAAKAGLMGLIKSVALENAKFGVTANIVSFGYIDTGMTKSLPAKVYESAMKRVPMKHPGDPGDAAKILVDLCGEHTNYMSGQVIRVNGMLYV